MALDPLKLSASSRCPSLGNEHEHHESSDEKHNKTNATYYLLDNALLLRELRANGKSGLARGWHVLVFQLGIVIIIHVCRVTALGTRVHSSTRAVSKIFLRVSTSLVRGFTVSVARRTGRLADRSADFREDAVPCQGGFLTRSYVGVVDKIFGCLLAVESRA